MKLKIILVIFSIVVAVVLLIPTKIVCGTQDRLKVQAEVDLLSEFVLLYYEKKGYTPNKLSDIVTEEIILRLPDDPWGYAYQYSVSEDGFVVWSRGAVLEADLSISSVNAKNREGKYDTFKTLSANGI
jgi:hypothetical protein